MGHHVYSCSEISTKPVHPAHVLTIIVDAVRHDPNIPFAAPNDPDFYVGGTDKLGKIRNGMSHPDGIGVR